VLFNLLNVTMYTSALVGLEGLLAGKPLIIASVIGAQIVATLFAVGWLASPGRRIAGRSTRSSGTEIRPGLA
jgi:hypothetical protein